MMVSSVNVKTVADFVLDSGYAPSGAMIEVCKGKIENISFSYYHPPSVDYAFSQHIPLQSTKHG